MDTTYVNGSNCLLKISWKYDDRNIVKKVWQTDSTVHSDACSQLRMYNMIVQKPNQILSDNWYIIRPLCEESISLQWIPFKKG